MPEFTLTQTNGPPVQFTGDHLCQYVSRNATFPGRDDSPRQWFVIDVYRTAGTAYVAHVQYRAGSRLGRELPTDRVLVAGSAESLYAALDAVEGSSFVTGWPGRCYADSEYTDAINQLADHLLGPEQPTVIP